MTRKREITSDLQDVRDAIEELFETWFELGLDGFSDCDGPFDDAVADVMRHDLHKIARDVDALRAIATSAYDAAQAEVAREQRANSAYHQWQVLG